MDNLLGLLYFGPVTVWVAVDPDVETGVLGGIFTAQHCKAPLTELCTEFLITKCNMVIRQNFVKGRGFVSYSTDLPHDAGRRQGAKSGQMTK